MLLFRSRSWWKVFLVAGTVGVSSVASPISFGIQGGMNFADLSYSASRSTSTRSGFALGGHLEFSLLGIVYLQPELMYIQKGAVDVPTKDVIQLDYLEVPVLMKFKLGITPIHVELLGGPYLGFALSTKTALATGGSSTLSDATGTDIGAILGVGAELDISDSTSLFANLRYSMGFTNTSDTAGLTRKNIGTLVLAGLRFELL